MIWIAIALFILVDRYFYKPFRAASTIRVVMASFGMMLVIRSFVQAVWGPNQLTFVPGIAKPNELVKNLTLSMDMMILVPNKHFWIIAGTLIIMLALSWLLTKTKIGKSTAMKAVFGYVELAKVSGIDVEVIVKATWCVGGFCAVAAGVFLAMDLQMLETTMGFRMLLMFAKLF